jgi:glycolate oxidase iron-sulfur subunit
MTTCPSGVHYMHLVDQARAHVEKTYRRPFIDRLIRSRLAHVMTDPQRFRRALFAARLAKPLAGLLEFVGLKPLAAMLRLAPARLTGRGVVEPGVFAAQGPRRGRVALLSGCVANVLAPEINVAAIQVLTRHGYEVVLAHGEGCCGSLAHHMGREDEALTAARQNVDAWVREIDRDGLDAILTTASGCGTTMKDYGFMLRHDQAYAGNAARVAGLTQDICEFVHNIKYLKYVLRPPLRVAYHPACSPGSPSRTYRRVICAADRPELTTCCSQNWQIGCAIAKSLISIR